MSVPGTEETFEAAFERIEAAVDAGSTDLGELGFWRLLSRVKAEPMLANHWAEQAGRIDRRAFEARVWPRLPVWLGNLVLVLGAMVGALALGIALGTTSETVAGIGLVVAAVAWSVSFHDLAHWLVGRIVGIRFTCYFVSGPFPPRPGLKTDYATYLRTAPGARAWMHASGALVTKIAPFVVLAFGPAADAPLWSAAAVAVLGVFQIYTDVAFSTRSSDWKRFKRERRVARRQAAAGR